MEQCEETKAFCRCVLGAGHDGPHQCDASCGGSWHYNENGDFVVDSFPTPGGIR